MKGVSKKKSTDLRRLDPESPAYWEETLRREGLSMAAGRNKKLSYIGGPTDLEYVGGVIATDTGRVTPKDTQK